MGQDESEIEKPYDASAVVRAMKEARDRSRGYADFWQWPQDKAVAEWHVARNLMKFVAARSGETILSVQPAKPDPPDCVATLEGGGSIGIEVTELVDEATVRRHAIRRAAERRGETPDPKAAADPYETACWTPETLRAALVEAVTGKDVAAPGGPYLRYLVAIHTDETAVTRDLLHRAIAGLVMETRHIDEAYVLLSYEPAAVDEFPDGYPVLVLPVRRGPVQNSGAVG